MIPPEVHMLRSLNSMERAKLQLVAGETVKATASIEEAMAHLRKVLED